MEIPRIHDRCRRHPGAGIGANTAIFSVVNAVLLSPLPYPDGNRLVVVQSRNVKQDLEGQAFSPAGFREFEKQVTSFEYVAAARYNYTNVTRIEKPTQISDGLVTANYFDVLGVKPLLGRTFLLSDGAGGAQPTVVLGHTLWKKNFGARPDIIGENIMLDDVPHTVIGVMPKTFKEPFGIAEAWRMFPNEGGENLGSSSRYWGVLARPKRDVADGTIQAELNTIAARFVQADPVLYGLGLHHGSAPHARGGKLPGRASSRGRGRFACAFHHMRECRRASAGSRFRSAS